MKPENKKYRFQAASIHKTYKETLCPATSSPPPCLPHHSPPLPPPSPHPKPPSQPKQKPKPKSSLKVRQQFTWQFNEKTQTFSQHITDFATTRNNKPTQQDKSQIGKTGTAKARMLLWNGKPDMLELTDQAGGEKQSYFKQDLNKLREILKP